MSGRALREVQAFLLDAFQRTETIEEASALGQDCRQVVAGNERLSPAEQVDIYRRQYWARHLEALAEDFPALAFTLGDDAFEALCRAYLEASPPRSFTLRDLGLGLPAFLERAVDVPEARRALALDAARYEAAYIDVFDGPRVPPLTAADLRGASPERLAASTLRLSPVLSLLRLGSRVHELRFALRAGEPPLLPAAGDPVHLALFRQESTVRVEVLDPRAYDLLSALASGAQLAAACERVAAGLDERGAADLDARIGGWFSQWTRWGLLVEVVPQLG